MVTEKLSAGGILEEGGDRSNLAMAFLRKVLVFGRGGRKGRGEVSLRDCLTLTREKSIGK